MTITQLAKMLAKHIAQGRGEWEVTVFQWGYGQEPLADVIARPSCSLDLYSNPRPPSTEPAAEQDDDLDDLI